MLPHWKIKESKKPQMESAVILGTALSMQVMRGMVLGIKKPEFMRAAAFGNACEISR